MSGLEGRVVLVTGASRGLGRAVAIRCAGLGAVLVLTARTRGALEEVDDAVQAAGAQPATLITLDLLKGEMIDTLGAALFERFGRLDGLAAMAADLGPLTPVAHLDPAELGRIIGLNLLAQHRLIRSLDPLLRQSASGRAVFATCMAARAATAYWGCYAAGKAALEALVKAYAAEQGLTRVRANLVDPGIMDTRLRGRAFPGERPGQQAAPESHAGLVTDLLLPGCERNGELVAG